jgi:serine/threonine-protein kinase
MAVVYQGTHVLTGETVAVKVLSSQAADEANFARRFRREARVLMELRHPHIVPVTDFGEVDDLAFLVMPYLRVGNLAQRLQQGPLNAVDGGRIFGEIASALAFAHEKGIVHRDVKPSNILLTDQGQALLSDFGLAQIHDASVSLTGSMMLGTPAYVSPEMVRGEPVDARADQYALGIILFEMTTGHLPFNAETPMAILVKQANEPLPRPRDVSPNIPETVERVILRATAKNPRDRFGSVMEMNHYFQAALAHALDPQRFRAPTIALPETALAKPRFVEEKRRRRRWAALVPALLLLILCPTAFAMRDIRCLRRRERPPGISLRLNSPPCRGRSPPCRRWSSPMPVRRSRRRRCRRASPQLSPLRRRRRSR